MWMIFKIAWKNIWRNRLRSFVVITAISLGLWAGVFIMAFYLGLMDQRIHDMVEKELSHIQVHNPCFLEQDENLTDTIPDYHKLRSQLDDDPNVKAYAERTIVGGMIASATLTQGIRIIGIDPEKEQTIRSFGDHVTEGAYFEGVKRNPILLSEALAEKLKIGVKSKPILTVVDANGEITSGKFKVVGLYNSGNPMLDKTQAIVRAEDIANLAMVPGSYHEIAVLLHDEDRVNGTTEQLQRVSQGFLVETWMELSPEISYSMGIMDTFMLIFVGVIMLALLFGIINTMLMAVLERVRELGMLMAIGMNKPRVFFMILLETTMLSLVGAGVGLGLGFLSITYFGNAGIHLTSFSQAFTEFGFNPIVYPKLEAKFYFQVTIMVLFMAFFAALYPAFKAIRLNPVSAIRKV